MLITESNRTNYLPYLARLKSLFNEMDNSYRIAADYYGFHCTGCDENCCLTRFYHHTFLEYLFIYEGMQTLSADMRDSVIESAKDACKQMDDADAVGQSVRIMCPLNRDGRCVLYEYRPMICRLHGIAHQFNHPTIGVIHAPGCDEFAQQTRSKPYFTFDRTPLYVNMANTEKELKHTLNLKRKIKMTVAQIIVDGLTQ